MSPAAPQPPYQNTIAATTIPGIIFALGVAVLPLNFWGGIALMTASLPLALVMLTRAFFDQKKRQIGWIISVSIYLATIFIIWTPVNVSVVAHRDDANYLKGVDVDGITWQSNYSMFRIGVENERYDISSLDAFVATDLQAVEAHVTANGATCSASLVTTGRPYFAVNVRSQSGQEATLSTNLHSSQTVEINCDKMSGGTSFAVAIALVPRDEKFRTLPKWSEVSISFDAGRALRPVVLPPILKCYGSHDECIFPLLPNDYRSTFLYYLFAYNGLDAEYATNCKDDKCPGWTFVYNVDTSPLWGPARISH